MFAAKMHSEVQPELQRASGYFSLFSSKFPLCASQDSVSLVSCGGGIVDKRRNFAPKRLTVKDLTYSD